MSLQSEIIPFTLRTGTGTQTINHVRFPSVTAKAIIFLSVSDIGTNSEAYSFGVDDGTTHIGTGIGMTETFGVSLSARGYSTQFSLIAEQAQVSFGGAQMRMRGFVSAINVGSFDISMDINNTAGAEWFAIMIGGDGVQCAVGLYDTTLGSGTVNVGFDPVAVMKLSCPDAASTGEVAGAYHSYGFSTDCGSDTQVGWGVSCGTINSSSSSFQIDGVVQQDIVNSATTISDAVTLAFIANGFDVTVAGTPDWNIGFLAIGGESVSANLVSITQPTSTGIQNTAITASDPVVAFFASTNKVATAGAGQVDANLSFGCYDGLSQMSQWWGSVSGAVAPYKRDRISSTTKAITMATATGASTSTVNAAASCTLAANNIALNWSTIDATQRVVWALVLANNLTGGSNPCGANPQASITVLKQTTPIPGGETEFPFVATGGLSPASFTLSDGESQLFSALSAGTYGVSEDAPEGWTVTYSVSDGSPHDAIVLGTGEAVTVTVTNTLASTASVLRRYRRFSLPQSENAEIFVPRLEIVGAMGVGNDDDPAPTILMRLSRDGGNTWDSARTMAIGAANEYMKRAYLTRLGRGRNLVAELYSDSPVFIAWVACNLPQGVTKGSS